MSESLWDGVLRGAGVALRAGAAPVVVGARLAWLRPELDDPALPRARRDWTHTAKALVDEFFFATELALAETLPARELTRAAAEQEAMLDFLEEQGFLENPRSYHLDPVAPERARLTRTRVLDVSFQHLRFESGFAPHAGEPGAERWQAREPNHTAHAWLLRHRGAPRPWVVCVPGYRMGNPFVDFSGFGARWLHRQLGLNVAIPVLPLHGPRRTGRRGGDGFFTGDFVDTLHAQAQAVWDIRRLLAWLRVRGAEQVGLYGVSLGAYTAALLAGLDDDLRCVVAGTPAIDFARLLGAHVPGPMRHAASAAGLDLDRIALLLRPVSPLAVEPRVPREHRHLFAGVSDRLTPPDHARDLWLHWDKPRTHWYQGGHVSFFLDPGVSRAVEDALRGARMLS